MATKKQEPLRLMIYDATQRTGLSQSWFVGGALYESMRWLDDCQGFDSWEKALTWVVDRSIDTGRKVSQIQFWGHGSRGAAYLNGVALNENAFSVPRWSQLLGEIRWHLAPGASIWFRTCGTFGGDRGHAFARNWALGMGCRVAGHTHIIGPLQSGLHSLVPRQPPHWSREEGVEANGDMTVSGFKAPNTITCLHGSIPSGW